MQNLTASQQTLATATAEIVVAIAGPGSGKTTTLVERYAEFKSARTTIVTFTNAAAAHLRAKIAARGLPQPDFVGTLHAFCLVHLKRHRPDMTLLDEEQAAELLAEAAADIRSKVGLKKCRENLAAGLSDSQAERVLVMRYRAMLREHNAEDFDTLLLSFHEYASVFAVEVGHLMIDEYQDSGAMDAAIYHALRATRRFIVGDPDQAIYGFRGGRVKNLLELAERDGVYCHLLEENFRSGHNICIAAQNLIEHNRGRIAKVTRPALPFTGTVTGGVCDDEHQEIKAIAEWAAQQEGSIAILTRYNATREAITAGLKVAGLKVAEELRAEMPADFRLAMAALQVVGSPENTLAGFRLIKLRSGIGAARIAKDAKAIPATVAWLLHQQTNLPAWMETLGLSKAMRAMLMEAWSGVGAPQYWDTAADAMRVWLMQLADGPTQVLGGIQVMTLHASKGLEFDAVAIAGIEEGSLPGKELEEDRRLFYVGMTRARKSLFLTAARKRLNPYSKRVEDRQPSRFFAEITGKP